MPLGHIGAGNVLGWLWWQSGSIWIVTLAHGALNNWGQFAFKWVDDAPDVLGARKVGIILAAVNLTLMAAVFFKPQ